MENEKETHEFMNVESFSQLPFIRPPIQEKGIRLFGKEFGGVDSSDTAPPPNNDSHSADNNNNNENNGDDSRRFECHYCCRNFPTSQALGGHQNAHKRERQHAKRAHLQSAMVHNSLFDAHIYGLVNHTRLGPATSAPTLQPMTSSYPSWNKTSSNSSTRFYGNRNHASLSHHQPPPLPINGSPLGLWRIPSAAAAAATTTPSFNRDRSSTSSSSSPHNPLPLFAGDHQPASSQVFGNGTTSQGRYVYESKPSVKEQVSLDLHL